jgi:outer membrane protein assembly factor BamB
MPNLWITTAFGSASSRVWRSLLLAALLAVSATASAQFAGSWPSFRNGHYNWGLSENSCGSNTSVSKISGLSGTSCAVIGGDGTMYLGNGSGFYSLNGATGSWGRFGGIAAPVASAAAVGANGLIYVAYAGCLNALNVATGATVRSATIEKVPAATLSSPTIGSDGTLYIGSNGGNVYAFDATTGTEEWKYSTGGSIDGSPAIGYSGNVFVGSEDGYVYALNGGTGALEWSYNTNGAAVASP